MAKGEGLKRWENGVGKRGRVNDRKKGGRVMVGRWVR